MFPRFEHQLAKADSFIELNLTGLAEHLGGDALENVVSALHNPTLHFKTVIPGRLPSMRCCVIKSSEPQGRRRADGWS